LRRLGLVTVGLPPAVYSRTVIAHRKGPAIAGSGGGSNNPPL
jgi:hypothetical protein